MKPSTLPLLLALLLPCTPPAHPQASPETFTNPILPTGPDPWVIAHDGFFFYMNTTGKNLTIWKTRDITDLAHAEKKIVWTPPPTGPASFDLWAPELHRFDNKWYIYFAADAARGDNPSHRIFVVENPSPDPLDGTWTFKGKLADSTDKWAIDATVFEDRGRRFLLWAGWEGDRDGEQRIYIARLKNPWTIDSQRVMISRPTYPWEEVGDLPDRPDTPHVNVNEGPEILAHGQDLFLVFSASACWTDFYELGAARARSGADLLNPASWTKFNHPFFQQDRQAMVFGPGHNGFFQSPDGKQDWIVYHANPTPHAGCNEARSPRIQPFTWNPDGTPNFGRPIPTTTPLAKPSH